jgi:hypothetical protein
MPLQHFQQVSTLLYQHCSIKSVVTVLLLTLQVKLSNLHCSGSLAPVDRADGAGDEMLLLFDCCQLYNELVHPNNRRALGETAVNGATTGA